MLTARRPENLGLTSAIILFFLIAASVTRSDSRGETRKAADPLRILARCQSCHDGATRAGGLNLTSRAEALKGGKNGAALVPKNPEHSPIYLQTSAGKMPPGSPLNQEEIAALRRWIEAGAVWEKAAKPVAPARADAKWWSLQPIVRPTIPNVKDRNWVLTPLDAFVLAGLEAKGLHPSPPADRRTLIRRASFDLLGLPPTPQEVEAFVRDHDPHAYEHLIDRLLASPHYGERWGRHWLDVARFAESHGYEYDHLRDNAWHYRDYVIRSLNADKPYDRFLREQIAGDVLPGADSDGVIATGFLVGGPMDEAGKSAPALLARLRAREEEMEDIIGLVGQTCLGLTVNCSRCHDHKFDPITQKDYYRLKAALEGVNPGNRPTLTPALNQSNQAKQQVLKARAEAVRRSIAAIEDPVRARLLHDHAVAPLKPVPQPYAKWTFDRDASDSVRGIPGELSGGATVQNGRLKLNGPKAMLKTGPLPAEIREKTLEAWIALSDLAQHGGSALTIETEGGGQFDAIVFGERERGKWIAGSESFSRTKDLEAPVETSQPTEMVHMAIVYHADNRIEVYRNGKPYAQTYTPAGDNGTLRTYPAGRTHLLFGLRHTGSTDYLTGEIAGATLYDRALTPQEVQNSYRNAPGYVPETLLTQTLSAQERQSRAALLKEVERIREEMRQLDNPEQTYAAVSQQPAPTHILLRGDVQSEGEIVTPGGIASLKSCTSDFGLAADSPEAERRVKLAEWITDPRNPLTPRVIVNRVWQYHFGHGIVGTANDFGFNGERPTHPALLDWLAACFQASPTDNAPMGKPYALNNSLKRLHRLIMLSNTYRQSGLYNPKAAQIDTDDRLLWRYAPRRMEAEEARDSMLEVSGQLDLKMGGPSLRPFTVENFNSNFYRMTDPASPEFQRRTIYQMIIHSARNTLLESLDCPDPSTKTPRRSSTTTPIQALELMNNAFVVRQSRAFATRVLQKAGSAPSAQLAFAYALAYGRPPTIAETKRALSYLNAHSLESLCWAIYNSSEFLYVP